MVGSKDPRRNIRETISACASSFLTCADRALLSPHSSLSICSSRSLWPQPISPCTLVIFYCCFLLFFHGFAKTSGECFPHFPLFVFVTVVRLTGPLLSSLIFWGLFLCIWRLNRRLFKSSKNIWVPISPPPMPFIQSKGFSAFSPSAIPCKVLVWRYSLKMHVACQ